MATNSQIAFNPQGNTVVVAAAAAAPAGVQAPVNGKFDAQTTGQVRIVNAGTNTVHLGVGPSATEATANAVAATAGSPAAGIPLVPGAVEILRFPLGSYFSGLAASATTLYITPGEGL
jgi:hypothetical protein